MHLTCGKINADTLVPVLAPAWQTDKQIQSQRSFCQLMSVEPLSIAE